MKDDFQGKTIEQARDALLVRSRHDAYAYLGEHADALSKVAYASSVAGADFDGVAANILIHSDQYREATALLPDLEWSEHDEERSSEAHICYTAPAKDTGSTFDIRFFIEKTS